MNENPGCALTGVLRILVWWGVALLAAPSLAAEPVAFSRDVLPILSGKCFACHGPDEEERQADLRLDQRESALELQAIVPGDAAASALVERIFSSDPDVVMPPPQSGATLTAEQKATLKKWIEQGAEYRQHWAFVPPVSPPLPPVQNTQWCRNEIDRFIASRLEQEGLTPAPQADRYTLIRRLFLDLIGLPPTPEEADAFQADNDPRAYENLVDRLLKSPHYGERWGRLWLDIARYSDTNGYEKDRPRSIWPYRDWVIRALNADMPFDQFTIEQLAGDMLPDATLQQRIATGFHRNTMLNEEGGIDPLEYRFYAMVDRVATTGTVWLGLTTGCAQCHTHKYDPISHSDYYALMALLDNAEEPDLSVPDPQLLQQRTDALQDIEHQISLLPLSFPQEPSTETPSTEAPSTETPSTETPSTEAPSTEAPHSALDRAFASFVQSHTERAVDWRPMRASAAASNLPKLESLDDLSVYSSGDITKRDVFRLEFPLHTLGSAPLTALRLEAMADPRLPAGGPGRAFYEGRKGDFFLSDVTVRQDGQTLKFTGSSSNYGKISIGNGTAKAENVLDGNGSTGWSTSGREGETHHIVLNFESPIVPQGTLEIEMVFERHFAASLGRFRWSATSQSGPVTASPLSATLEQRLVDARTEATTEALIEPKDVELFRQFLLQCDELKVARKPLEKLQQQLPQLPVTMVFEERPADNPRKTYRHHRGEYLQTKEQVAPAVPAVFAGLPENEPANRLSFARWLVSERNPLVDRVQVDRAWGVFFGNPLVRSNGDYGTQSDPPTHPELLDWLATEFTRGGRSMKSLHKLIVLSATYRQASAVSRELLERDPENRLLARGPRLRLEAEIVRDSLLKASGLLSLKMFGPGVFPPQPESVTALAYGNTPWPVSSGEDRYRRSLYTFSKRTAPFAAFTVFDGPSGETCQARRERSNTPLQALTLLNDEMFLEMARTLAQRSFSAAEPETDPAVRTTRVAEDMFRQVLTRRPTADELQALVRFFQNQEQRFATGQLSAKTITGAEAGSSELAAWVLTARAIMNLDEAITRE